MNIIKIPINDMLNNKARTVGLVAIIAIIFCLLAILLTLREGMNGELSFVTASRINVKSRLPQSPLLPLRYLDTLKSIPGIEAISYFMATQGKTGNNDAPLQILFVPPAETLDVYPDFSLNAEFKEKWRTTRNGAVIGQDLANSRNWKVGDSVPLRTGMMNSGGSRIWDFEIVGIYDTDLGLPYTEFFLGNYEYYNEYIADPDRKSIVYLYLVRVTDPQMADQVAGRIDQEFATGSPQTLTRSQREETLAYINQFADMANILIGIGILAFLSLAFVLTSSIRMMFEKKRKILATLSALGFSRKMILSLLLWDGILLIIPGFLARMSIAAFFISLSGPYIRQILETFYINASVLLLSLCICMLLLATISLLPMMHVLRFHLVDELRR